MHNGLSQRSVDRRALLKSGLVVGGTAAWVVPGVQLLTISKASAAVVSGNPGGSTTTTPNQPGNTTTTTPNQPNQPGSTVTTTTTATTTVTAPGSQAVLPPSKGIDATSESRTKSSRRTASDPGGLGFDPTSESRGSGGHKAASSGSQPLASTGANLATQLTAAGAAVATGVAAIAVERATRKSAAADGPDVRPLPHRRRH